MTTVPVLHEHLPRGDAGDAGDSVPLGWRRRALTSPWLPSVVLAGTAAVVSLPSWRVSLWTDEAATLAATDRSWSDLGRLLGDVDAVHGAYYAFMLAWTRVVGEGELLVRLPSALAVGGTAALVLVLGRRLTTPGGALLAALLAAFLPRMSWAGIEARPFAFSALLAVGATLAFVAACEHPSARSWVAYAVVMVLGVLVNVYLLFLVGAHGLTLLTGHHRRRSEVTGFIVSSLSAVVAVTPFLLLVRSQQGQLGDRDLGPVGVGRRVLVNQVFLGETPSREAAAWWFTAGWQAASVLATVLALTMVLGALMSSGSSWLRSRATGIALPWVAVPTCAVVTMAILGAPVYQPRYLTFTVPAVALLLGDAFSRLRRGRRWLAVTSVLLLCLVAVDLSQRTPHAKAGSDWAQAAAVLAERARPGDAVYFVPRYPVTGDGGNVTSRRLAVAYPSAFRGLTDLTLRQEPSTSGTLDGTSAPLERVRPLIAQQRTIWVIYGRRYDSDAIASSERVLGGAGFEAVFGWNGPSTRVLEYEARGGGGASPATIRWASAR